MGASETLTTIGPPGADIDIARRSQFIVPRSIELDLTPETVEELHFTPVRLRFEADLVDLAEPGRHTLDGDEPLVGHWRYQVTDLHLADVTEPDLARIRLKDLLRDALSAVVRLAPRMWDETSPLDQVALRAYVVAQLAGADPTKYAAEHLEVTPNAAAQRIFRLRKAGRLPVVPKGAL